MTDQPPTEIPPLPEYAGNPFIERLGPIRTLKGVQDSLNRPPILMGYDRNRPPEERMHAVLRLLRFSQATVTAREVGLKVDQMIRQGYVGRNPRTTEWYRYAQSCADFERGLVEETHKARSSGRSQPSVEKVFDDLAPVNDTSQSCLVVGPPGAGKTHSLALALSAYPQVIVHDDPMRIAQIVWLRVECPPNGSLKGLCGFFFAAVDKALREAGFKSDLEKEYRNRTLHVQLAGMARVANLHAVGILVIDEIQHVKVSRGEGHSLLNVLVTLRNAIGVSLMMIGTMSALPILQRTFRDARRADGIGSISFSRMAPASLTDHQAEEGQSEEGVSVVPVYGEEFENFVRRMWRWQYTREHTELSVELLNAFYHETQGITDLVIKLFALCQMALMSISAGREDFEETITPELVEEVAARNFNTVRKFITALRENDTKALSAFEDLIDYGDWFYAQVTGLGVPERTPMHDIDHGEMRMPPMIVEGAIDRAVLDQVLEGFGVPRAERDAFAASNRELIEAGDLPGLVKVTRNSLEQLAARDALDTKRKEKPATSPDDLRSRLDGVTNPANVAVALDATDLESALDG